MAQKKEDLYVGIMSIMHTIILNPNKNIDLTTLTDLDILKKEYQNYAQSI
jgi:hypothetical protein